MFVSKVIKNNTYLKTGLPQNLQETYLLLLIRVSPPGEYGHLQENLVYITVSISLHQSLLF